MDVLFSSEALVEYVGIWTRMKQGGELSDEEERVADTMKEHQEFDPFWRQGDAAIHPQEIDNYVVNPMIHTRLHVIIEKQVFDQNPVETAKALNALLNNGLSRHDAIHQIAGLWGDLYFRSIRGGGFMDEFGYIKALEGMGLSSKAIE